MDGIAQIISKKTHEQIVILTYIQDRPKSCAILNRNLVSSTGYSERTIRRIVRELVLDHKCPIGSSTQDGYYWITDTKEIEENYERLRKRALKILQRAAAMKKIGVSDVVNQLQLELEKGAN